MVKLTHPGAISPAASAVGRGNKKADTRPELAIRSLLHAYGYRFRKNYLVRLLNQRAVRPDIVFTRRKVAVFVDGCFWHCCPEHGTAPRSNSSYWQQKLKGNVERDRKNDCALVAAGWTVVRVWEHEASEAAAQKIANILKAKEQSRV